MSFENDFPFLAHIIFGETFDLCQVALAFDPLNPGGGKRRFRKWFDVDLLLILLLLLLLILV